jgi:hypothetical protein
MATQVNRQVNIFIASGEAEKAYDRLIKKEQTLKEELVKATNPKDIARLNTELKKLEEPLDRAAKKAKGTLQPSLREIQNTIAALNRELKNVAVGSKEFDQLSLKVRQAKIEMGEAQLKAQGMNKTLGQKAFGGVSSFMQGVGLGFGVEIFSSAATLVKDFFAGSLEEANEARRQVNNLTQALTASGDVDVFDRLIGKANEFAQTFKFLDNDDITGVFTKLTDYGKLTEDQMNKLIPVIIDFYAKQQLAGNTAFTLDQSASVIIKGLEGQGRALKEYGINLKEGGNLTERFGIILNDLGGKVKGAGDAFANDLTGQVATAHQELKNLQEDLGSNLVPLWEKLKIGALTAFKGIIEGLKDLKVKFDEAFLSTDELANKRAKAAGDRQQELIKENALRFASDAALKSLAEQEEILKAEQLMAKRSKELFEQKEALAVAMGNAFSKEQQDRYNQSLQDAANVKALEESIRIQRSKRVIGTSSGEDSAGKSKGDDDLARLLKEIAAKAWDLDLVNADNFTKAYAKINEFYDRWVERAKGNAKALKEIEGLRTRETALLIDQYVQIVDDAETKRRKRKADRDKAEEDRIQNERLAKLAAFQEQVARLAAESADRQLGGRRFRNEIDVLVGNSKMRLAAKMDQLELERIAEINAAEKTGAAVLDIERKYAFLRNQAETASLSQRIQQVVGFASQANAIFQSFSDLRAQKENAELEQDRIVNERKKDNFRRQLDGKILNQKEYDRKVSELDRQLEEKEKQARIREFNRNKTSQLLNATVNIAAQVAANLTPPWMAAIVAALGAIQLGVIASAQPPKFEKGTLLNGPLHRDGGMPILDPRSGRKVAEVEGGEVILSRNTVRNNPDLVGQLLHSSMHRNGQNIMPGWKTITPSYFNLPHISRSINQVRLFENGGVMPGSTASTGGSSIDQELIRNMAVSIEMLNMQLANGIQAFTVITQQEGQQARLDDIRTDATMR